MRIAITGPQNTGKTTFLKDFLNVVPSYATPQLTYRDIIKEKKLDINQKTTEESQRAIRDFLYQQIIDNTAKNILFDRCIIDNYIYTAAAETNHIPQGFLDETEKMMYHSLDFLDALLYIPTSASVKLESDGTRDIDVLFIDKINRLFLEMLFKIARTRETPIWTITGDREDRVNQVKKLLGE